MIGTLQFIKKGLTHKIYPVNQLEKEFIDKEFDKRHRQDCMVWLNKPNPFGFSVFIA